MGKVTIGSVDFKRTHAQLIITALMVDLLWADRILETDSVKINLDELKTNIMSHISHFEGDDDMRSLLTEVASLRLDLLAERISSAKNQGSP